MEQRCGHGKYKGEKLCGFMKKLQYPVKVGTCNPALAKLLIEQYGGADGELVVALRYLNQRYTIPDKVIGLLTDIGTEEFAHLEMIATMVYKLTKDATPEQMKALVSTLITSIMTAHFITITRLVFHLLQPIYKLKVIQLPTYTKILRLKKSACHISMAYQPI